MNLTLIGIFIAIIAATILAAYLVNRFFNRLIRHSTEIMQNDPTNYLFLRHIITALIYVVGFSTAIYIILYVQVFLIKIGSSLSFL